uniref:Leucine rich repeat containing 20 n=1 Tax=Macaca fascicularis TaxID=9541 RepID=A0A7N9DEA5_MACFA
MLHVHVFRSIPDLANSTPFPRENPIWSPGPIDPGMYRTSHSVFPLSGVLPPEAAHKAVTPFGRERAGYPSARASSARAAPALIGCAQPGPSLLPPRRRSWRGDWRSGRARSSRSPRAPPRRLGTRLGRRRRRERDCEAQGARRHCRHLAECKLVSFPIGIYKVLRNVSGQIHLITLANNELKSLTSKFMTTFSQLRDVPVEKLAAMPALRSINLRFNPLNAEVRVIAPPLIKFDMLMSPDGARAPLP